MEPVVVHLRTTKATVLGVLAGVAALIWWSVGILFWLAAEMSGAPVFFGLLIGLWLLACAAHYIGLAIQKPVALKMDAKGISGYYAEPAIWPEIMEIETFSNGKNHRYLGFAFLNPDIITARQTAWRRFLNWWNSPRGRHQIVISETLLLDANADGLAAIARAFHRAA